MMSVPKSEMQYYKNLPLPNKGFANICFFDTNKCMILDGQTFADQCVANTAQKIHDA